MKTILNVSHLQKTFKQKKVLIDVSFSLKEGEIVGFVGRNGAGKSTTMKCVAGLLDPQGGKIEIGGKDIVKQRESALRRIAAQIEDPALFETMSGRDNLRLFGALNHVKRERIEQMEAFSGLKDALKRRVGDLFHGNEAKTCFIDRFAEKTAGPAAGRTDERTGCSRRANAAK